MRCRVGDLAVCIKSTKGKTLADPLGHFCKVLSLAQTTGVFLLPDGYQQQSFGPGYWVVEWNVEMAYPTTGGVRFTKFGICPDRALKPIRDPGEDAQDETLQWLPVPTKEIA